ncbi:MULTISPECIES: transcription repressor NadR [Clostridium]|uniref:transcription repressor NadR n=1 Tax=Clostridium TaxID=1485 RepID=UPI00069E90C4|nr:MULTISPECIES: transcription repressor NadR [Clostridium]KOF57724.1 transcriptional regulator [Clostridium sp. DMHC 10]MCD2348951.1 transcription repressor NadR [Clostridium guangxiense]
MNSDERRNSIKKELEDKGKPIKGSVLAKEFGVTRQIIVKDIAILRAEGCDIFATPKGYIINKSTTSIIKRVIAVSHRPEEIEDELNSIVKFGGTVEDVIIEHSLYGEIRGVLMVKTPYDVQNFMEKLNKHRAEPLSILTGGVHLHTISADNEDDLNKIIDELNGKGYIISD